MNCRDHIVITFCIVPFWLIYPAIKIHIIIKIVAPKRYNLNLAHLESHEQIKYTAQPVKNQKGNKFI